jgi:large subunit ribosomal protein L29
MKIQDVRKKSDKDLGKLLTELKETVRDLKFRISSKEVKNHRLLGVAKKDIARVLTIMKERHDSR